MTGCGDDICCPARAWLAILALGSWALLCVLDLSAARWSEHAEDDEEDTFRWLSHGVSLAVLAFATIALVVAGLWPRIGSESAKVTKLSDGVGVNRLASLEAQRCFALALHVTLVACALGRLALQLFAGREPQVWIGLSTLYTLVSLFVAHRVMGPAPKPGVVWVDNIVPASHADCASRIDCSKHNRNGAAFQDYHNGVAVNVDMDLPAVVADKTYQQGGSLPSSPSSRPAGDEIPGGYSVHVNITSTGRLEGWRPLFKDPTFGGSLPPRLPPLGFGASTPGAASPKEVSPSGFIMGGTPANDFCFSAPSRQAEFPPAEEVEIPINAEEAAKKASLRLSRASIQLQGLDIPDPAAVSRQSSESGLTDGSDSQGAGASHVGPLGANEEGQPPSPAVEPSEAEGRCQGEVSQEKDSGASSVTFEPSARFESHSNSTSGNEHLLNRAPPQEPRASEK